MTQEPYPAGHLSFIRTSLQRPLTVFLPPVHSYIEPEYVKAFKDTGSLQLSSFARFRQHKDEHRGDKDEGTAFSLVNDAAKDRSFGVVTVSGDNAYVLSTTMRTGADIDAAFPGNSSFEIFEPIGFAAAIANEIPGCTHAMIGQCIYVDARLLISSGNAPTIDDLKDEAEPDKVSLGKVLAHGNSIKGPKPYFLKNRNHEQAEYRFIWETNKPVMSHLDITAPELIKFCKF